MGALQYSSRCRPVGTSFLSVQDPRLICLQMYSRYRGALGGLITIATSPSNAFNESNQLVNWLLIEKIKEVR